MDSNECGPRALTAWKVYVLGACRKTSYLESHDEPVSEVYERESVRSQGR